MKSHKPQLYIWNDSTVRNCTAPFDMTAHPSLRAGRTCTGHDSKSCSLQRNMYVCHHVTYLPVWSIYIHYIKTIYTKTIILYYS